MKLQKVFRLILIENHYNMWIMLYIINKIILEFLEKLVTFKHIYNIIWKINFICVAIKLIIKMINYNDNN